jgi:Condensation domain
MPGHLFRAWVSPGLGEPRSVSFGLHEMITDNLSCARLSAEVSRLISGEGAAPPEASYAEYAQEERHRPIPPDLAGYWRREFADLGQFPAGITADGPDPSGEPAGEWILILPDHLGRALRTVSQANRVSLFMVVTALLNMTIASMYGAGDITLATTTSTRTKRFVNVQGNFSNVTVTRTAIPQGASFTDVLTATRRAVLGTLRHQPVPFPRLRDLIGETLEAPRIRVHYLPRHTHHYSTTLDTKPSGAAWKEDTDFAGWPLDLGFAEDSLGRVAIWANYDPRLFTHATVRAVVSAYQRLLGLVAADGTLTCRDLRRQLAA